MTFDLSVSDALQHVGFSSGTCLLARLAERTPPLRGHIKITHTHPHTPKSARITPTHNGRPPQTCPHDVWMQYHAIGPNHGQIRLIAI